MTECVLTIVLVMSSVVSLTVDVVSSDSLIEFLFWCLTVVCMLSCVMSISLMVVDCCRGYDDANWRLEGKELEEELHRVESLCRQFASRHSRDGFLLAIDLKHQVRSP
jgi:hypothetical protein